MNNTLLYSAEKRQLDQLFWGMTGISIISIIASVLSQSIYPMLIPLGLMGLYVSIVDIRLVYYGLVALLTFSTEIELPGGIGTDLPGEPLMIFITGIYILLILTYPKKAEIPIKNSVTALILFHVVWIAITAFTAENMIVSIKFLLAKVWYVIPFYFAPFVFLKEKKHIRKLIYLLIIGVLLAAVYVMFNHAASGFRFDTIEKSVQPIFRNHVNYACLLTVTIPYMWISLIWLKKQKGLKFLLIGVNLFILSAIYFSYTRAAILSVIIGVGAFFILKFKLTRISFIAAILGASLFLTFMVRENTYLDYAPNFEKTISHAQFDNLINATAKGEDISTMERVYRWIAGVQMIVERPIVGYGGGNFYPYYKQKTVSSFETYVSHNPEKSGIHCYYLMTGVEQGIPGFIIFILLCFYILYEGEKTYHKLKDPFYKSLTAGAYMSVIIILSILIVNDLLEADKVGPFFFLGAAFIVLSKRSIKKNNQINS